MTFARVRIETASRLHFGLLGWGAQAARQFGGVGLMIAYPRIKLVAERAPAWIAVGPLADRVEQLLAELAARAREAGAILCPCRIAIETVPREHVGLGVGTQLSLAVARAVFDLAGATDTPVETLARLTGRGARSGIGIHGFALGGLIVDGGRKRSTELPPMAARHPFPEEWSVVVVQPEGPIGLHGSEERRAFADLPPIAPRETEALCKLVLLDLLPAVRERDLAAFGAALSEIQERVGACFASAQGGVFHSPDAASIALELRRLGLAGVGQSSWGPTIYGFTRASAIELRELAEHVRRKFDLGGSSVFVTHAANSGARVAHDRSAANA
jgi:beta-ribofuranosylaminobenzene 5'-phosphate synthase